MTLRARFTLARAAFRLDVDLVAEAGETVVVVGPNGAGKSSTLHAIAGLLRADGGRIALGDEVLDGGPGGPFVPPEARGAGFVFQDRLLFPRMTALDNVAYGLRARGVPRREARAAAAAWLERVGLGSLCAVRPGRLSGGQAQRVALARALAAAPRLLLLDEPLAAVDASAKTQLRAEIRAQLAAFPGVRLIVVHDIGDALALADRIAVLEHGRIVQAGAIGEIVSRPASRYVADLVGLNCFRGVCRGGVLETACGERLVVSTSVEGPALATVHPRAVALFRARPAGSPRNVWAAPVVGVERALGGVRVQTGGALPLVAEVTPAAVEELRLREGGEVWVALKATEITVAPA